MKLAIIEKARQSFNSNQRSMDLVRPVQNQYVFVVSFANKIHKRPIVITKTYGFDPVLKCQCPSMIAFAQTVTDLTKYIHQALPNNTLK
jgi:hypothetical protein